MDPALHLCLIWSQRQGKTNVTMLAGSVALRRLFIILHLGPRIFFGQPIFWTVDRLLGSGLRHSLDCDVDSDRRSGLDLYLGANFCEHGIGAIEQVHEQHRVNSEIAR